MQIETAAAATTTIEHKGTKEKYTQEKGSITGIEMIGHLGVSVANEMTNVAQEIDLRQGVMPIMMIVIQHPNTSSGKLAYNLHLWSLTTSSYDERVRLNGI